MSSLVASRGCISTRGAGYCLTSGPIRRVCVPREELADHAPRGEEDRELGVDVIGGAYGNRRR